MVDTQRESVKDLYALYKYEHFVTEMLINPLRTPIQWH